MPSQRLFHHSAFADVRHLLRLKHEQNLTISLGIPTLNEAATIGNIVTTLRASLMEETPLLDEIVVIDSGSTDDTRSIATAAGARVYLASDILPEAGPACGKGENLWKALYVMHSDLLCFIDGDISAIHPRFVTGLLGPLLTHSEPGYAKAYYERPWAGAAADPHCGGRVTEILIRPLLAAFYPELNGIIQPLAGEFAARRNLLCSLPYPTGYSIEIAHLLCVPPESLVQVDLETRQHRNRPTDELGRMSHDLLQTFLHFLRERNDLNPQAGTGSGLHQFSRSSTSSSIHVSTEIIRPPYAI